MACTNDGSYPRVSGTASTVSAPAGTASADTSPYLVLCDAPERIPQEISRTILPLLSGPESAQTAGATSGTYDTYTLYKCEIPLTGASQKFRLFFWEESHLSSDAYIIVAAHVTSGSRTIGSVKEQISNQIQAGGLCIAKAQLFGTADSASALNSTIGTTEIQIFRYSLPSGTFKGGIIEFEVASGSATDLRLRFLVSGSTSIAGAWGDPLAWPWQEKTGGTVIHSRGWWPKSQITLPVTPNLEVSPTVGSSSREWTVYPSHTGPEMSSTGFAWQGSTADPHGTSQGNKGCWGANLAYELTLTNADTTKKWGALARIVARNNIGGPWYGAATIVTPTGYPNKGMENLQGGTSYVQGKVAVDVSNTEVPIPVPKNNGSQLLRLVMVNGGGCSLPVNVVVVGQVAISQSEEPE